jgi:hypothetical protein
MNRFLIAATAAGVLLTAAACTDPSASAAPTRHSKTHKATSNVVTSRASVSGSGSADRWFLTLRGKHQPVSVSKTTYKRCQIGDRYPACADG